MATLAVLTLTFAAMSFQDILNALYVALGLGLVIFIHELGHFAVAKWCNVRVERFSIGFGPVLWKYTRGETEYALSAIPFGGYVKMLGQDDADPSQLTDSQLARDPRSYTAKSVPQRIAIISAGVINNLVSAVLFFIVAFMFGVQYQPAVVGQVVPGMPAWEAGLRMGDRITQIGSRADEHLRFVDVRQAVALSSGPIEVSGDRDGQPFTVTVHPKSEGQMFPTIGVEGEQGLKLIEAEKLSPAVPGSAAARATPAFQPGDEIVQIDDMPITRYADLQRVLAEKRDETVQIHVRRKGDASAKPVAIRVEPNRFRRLGLWMDIGTVSAIQQGSPAGRSKLKVGDKITHVISDHQERSIGSDLDPLQLPDFFASLHGKDVTLRVKREGTGGDDTEEITLVPDNRPGWVERPMGNDSPLSVPALGIAFHVLHHVIKVEPGSAADGKIKAMDNIQKIEFVLPPGTPSDSFPQQAALTFEEEQRNWVEAFWMMQAARERIVRLTVKSQGEAEARVVEVVPQEDPNWNLPMRGVRMQQLVKIRQASNLSEAVTLGFQHTRDSIVDMYMTIRSLVSGRISARALGGPLRIAEAAYYFSERGIPDLMLFLGMLSVSLAILNFMPIPVLDGGHFVFLCWEGIRGKPPSERVVIAANYVGLALVLSLMLWVLYMDISSLVVRFWS